MIISYTLIFSSTLFNISDFTIKYNQDSLSRGRKALFISFFQSEPQKLLCLLALSRLHYCNSFLSGSSCCMLQIVKNKYIWFLKLVGISRTPNTNQPPFPPAIETSINFLTLRKLIRLQSQVWPHFCITFLYMSNILSYIRYSLAIHFMKLHPSYSTSFTFRIPSCFSIVHISSPPLSAF